MMFECFEYVDTQLYCKKKHNPSQFIIFAIKFMKMKHFLNIKKSTFSHTYLMFSLTKTSITPTLFTSVSLTNKKQITAIFHAV